MKKRAAGTGRKQEKTPVGMSVAMQQLMLPVMATHRVRCRIAEVSASYKT